MKTQGNMFSFNFTVQDQWVIKDPGTLLGYFFWYVNVKNQNFFLATSNKVYRLIQHKLEHDIKATKNAGNKQIK